MEKCRYGSIEKNTRRKLAVDDVCSSNGATYVWGEVVSGCEGPKASSLHALHHIEIGPITLLLAFSSQPGTLAALV